MKYITFILSSVLCILILISCSSSSDTSSAVLPTEDGYTSFTDTDNTIGFTYPDDWVLQEGFMWTIAIVQSPLESPEDTFSENMSYISQDIADLWVKDFTEYVDKNLEQIELFLTDYAFIGREKISILGLEWEKIQYTFTQWEYKLLTTQYLIQNNSQATTITVSHTQDQPNAFDEIFQKIIQSTKIL